MLTSWLIRHSTNLCRRFVRIDRSRITFSDFSFTSDVCGFRCRGDSDGFDMRRRIACNGSICWMREQQGRSEGSEVPLIISSTSFLMKPWSCFGFEWAVCSVPSSSRSPRTMSPSTSISAVSSSFFLFDRSSTLPRVDFLTMVHPFLVGGVSCRLGG